MSSAETDKAADAAPAPSRSRLRPRDSASLIVIDRGGASLRVLMGRRHPRHAFMPGKLVFPGGRTDPADGRVKVADDLDGAERAKLDFRVARPGGPRARAIALSAIREAYEEAGLLVGRPGAFVAHHPSWAGFAAHRVVPALRGLRLVARAITPPGQVRRFDTRFFACWTDEVALTLAEGGPSDELGNLAWLTLGQASTGDVPAITKAVLEELGLRLRTDPELRPGGAVPFYRMVGKRMIRELL